MLTAKIKFCTLTNADFAIDLHIHGCWLCGERSCRLKEKKF